MSSSEQPPAASGSINYPLQLRPAFGKSTTAYSAMDHASIPSASAKSALNAPKIQMHHGDNLAIEADAFIDGNGNGSTEMGHTHGHATEDEEDLITWDDDELIEIKNDAQLEDLLTGEKDEIEPLSPARWPIIDYAELHCSPTADALDSGIVSDGTQTDAPNEDGHQYSVSPEPARLESFAEPGKLWLSTLEETKQQHKAPSLSSAGLQDLKVPRWGSLRRSKRPEASPWMEELERLQIQEQVAMQALRRLVWAAEDAGEDDCERDSHKCIRAPEDQASKREAIAVGSVSRNVITVNSVDIRP
ncbi:hypothetical protein EJ08DRAFT_664431 [Tothia fuscella]|uniref:Uncharacterized protein n=1 Tax=Tothia fuscella TaxID=1048955 RepID=A0A9P4NJI7_9PEZI|nr:hypothetical protein EJ08DRAFT_664431 [Tothia fuscella]